MRFNELFIRHRKTEPSSVNLLRILIMIILISSLTGYIAILIIEVTSDEPVLTNTVVEAMEIPIPGGSQEIKLDESCKEYLEQPKASSESNNYIGYFKNVQNLTCVNVVALIVDSNYNATKSQDLMKFTATDSEYNPLRYESKFNETNINKLPAYVKELSTSNFYYMKHKRNKDHLGIEPTYYRQGYIVSSIQNVPFDYEAGDFFASQIVLTVQNFLLKKETEQRTRTLLSVFGLVGGAWGLAAAFYATLFGVDIIRPWGCVQFYCCGIRNKTHNKLKKSLPVIPLVKSSERPLPSFSRDVSRDEHAALQQRVDALEVFLREYVVDDFLPIIIIIKQPPTTMLYTNDI
ncbi:15599_t:CDS:10 [Funneliformis geosporum]|uniref:15599_t:CDS:1 n=1 Tax=Funneliformis geosporum TaxID=1117311 RepID=A0A9W4SC05_9GLOM|nr:15599_t:CDS:10 [Funneliformis geosporum]